MAALGLVKRRRRQLRRSGFSSLGASMMERALHRRRKRRSTTARSGAARAMRRKVRQLARRAVKSYSKNPGPAQPRRVIGTSPTVYTRSGLRLRYPGGVLLCGDSAYTFKICFARGRGRFAPLNARVVRVEYVNAAKARRVYGRVAPFRHDFKTRVIVSGVEGGGAWQKIHMRGDSALWRAS